MIKRAFFYTTRKRGETLILLLILFVISTRLSILAAVDQSACGAESGSSIATIKIVDTHLDGSFPSCLCPKNLKAIKASCVFGASAAEKAPRPAVCRQF